VRITNRTHWSTKDIGTLIRRVAQDELNTGQLKTARITIKYQRGDRGALGWCFYGTMRNPCVVMRLMLPRPGSPLDLVLLAQVIAHELGHAKGIRHRDMKNTRYGYIDGWRERYAWATAFPIREQVVKPKPDRVVVRASRCEAMVAKYRTKVKRDQTILRKWTRKLRYYELRQAPQKVEKVSE